MRVEIAACLLTLSLVMLVPESLPPPLANPLKRGVAAQGTAIRAAQAQSGARALRETLIQGGETERVEFNRRNVPAQASRDEKNGADPAADVERLQHVW